ncbi:hypothetical protein [Azospirillum largimobile]
MDDVSLWVLFRHPEYMVLDIRGHGLKAGTTTLEPANVVAPAFNP